MRTKIEIARKEPVQRRSIDLRNSILEAANHVLKKYGPHGFTTNKVADRAGVNIASLYQYYPNKEALLFHLVEIEWNQTVELIEPILRRTDLGYRQRLCVFIDTFFETEAAEADIRQALKAAAIPIEETTEFKALKRRADRMFLDFFGLVFEDMAGEELRRRVDFIWHVLASFSESATPKNRAEVRTDARMIGEMICKYFDIQ